MLTCVKIPITTSALITFDSVDFSALLIKHAPCEERDDLRQTVESDVVRKNMNKSLRSFLSFFGEQVAHISCENFFIFLIILASDIYTCTSIIIQALKDKLEKPCG